MPYLSALFKPSLNLSLHALPFKHLHTPSPSNLTLVLSTLSLSVYIHQLSLSVYIHLLCDIQCRAMLYARTHEDSSRALSLTLDEKNAELEERSSEVQTLTSEVQTHVL